MNPSENISTLVELTTHELEFIADNLVTLAELEADLERSGYEGEFTDYDELKRLAALLRLRAQVAA